MNIKIYQDRYTETCNIAGTQFEQNATTIKLDFSELDFIDDECVKTVHFFHDSLEEANYIGDSIIQKDEFKIPKSITEYENVLAFVQITKEDFIWKTKVFNLDFYKSLDVDKTLDEDELGILQELILEVKEIQNVTTDKFEEVAAKATEDFNKNATKKTNSFNSNAETKTTEFNNNATNKTELFNSNATSKETSYNDNATSKLNEYNENHTSKLNAYNENAQDKTEEYDEHIEELDNIVSKNIASGEIILIDDALKYKIFGVKVDGNAEQTTTTGKQMLQMCAEIRTQNGVTFIKNADGSVTLDGTATAGTFCNLNTSYSNSDDKKYFTLENGKTYTIYCKNISSNMYFVVRSKTQNDYLLDTSDGNELAVKTYNKTTDEGCYGYLYVPTGSSFDNYTVYPMICEGQYESLEWEEYTGGEASPNPDYPQDITVIKDSVKIKQVGKNLADNNLLGYAIGGDDGISYFSSSDCLTEVIKCKPNTTYSISKKAGNRFHVATTEEEPVQGSKVNSLYNQASSLSCTITTPLNANFLLVYVKSSDGTDTSEDIKLQIEEGSVATDYEEYKSNEYTINLNSDELVKLTDDIKDTIEIDKSGNVSLNKRTGKIVLDENTNPTIASQNYPNLFFFSLSALGMNVNSLKAISDYFTFVDDTRITDNASANTYLEYGQFAFRHGTVDRIYFKIADVTTGSDFKAWLAENNVTVYYEIAEPTTTSLAQLTNFKTFEGINHFFLEANLSTNFEIKYAQDLQKVISKQQEEIDELKTLLSSTATSAMLLDNLENDLVEEV